MVEGSDFIEILREACNLAGFDFDEAAGKQNAAKYKRLRAIKRRKLDILATYAKLARQAWTDSARAWAIARKKYVGRDVIDKWRLGNAPGLPAMLKAEPEKAWAAVGLVRYNRDGEPYPYFRRCLVIPYYEHDRVVYFTSRRYRDRDEAGNDIPGNKCLSMPAPDKQTKRGGMAPPDGFNLPVLDDLGPLRDKGLLLCEAPLEALYCSEHGHPAIGILSAAIRSGLRERLWRLPELGVTVYLMLDGDMDRAKCCQVAADLGPDTRICQIPADKDPDDLPPDELAQAKTAAWPLLDVANELIKEAAK